MKSFGMDATLRLVSVGVKAERGKTTRNRKCLKTKHLRHGFRCEEST